MLDSLILYKKYNDFLYYVYLLIDKMPKNKKIVIGYDIRKYLIINLKLIINYWYFKDNKYLLSLNINMIILNNMIRIIYKRKYISIKNYNAYIKKSGEIVCICKGLLKYEDVKD